MTCCTMFDFFLLYLFFLCLIFFFFFFQAEDGIRDIGVTGVQTCALPISEWFDHDGETIVVEPFRVKSFPVIKDLVVDRSALDRIVQAGGFISARAGSADRKSVV